MPSNLLNIIAGIIAASASFAAWLRMWYCIRRNGVRPNLLTWIVWDILAFVLLKSELRAIGANWALALLINDLICISITAVILIFLAWRDHFKFSSIITRARRFDLTIWVDIFCLIAIGVASFIWWRTSSALIALICYSFIDFVAIIPTAYGVWWDYQNEDAWEWVLFQISNTAVIFTVTKLSFGQLAYPLAVFSATTMVNMVRLWVWRRRQNR